jgi:hypothetical protein
MRSNFMRHVVTDVVICEACAVCGQNPRVKFEECDEWRYGAMRYKVHTAGPSLLKEQCLVVVLCTGTCCG